MSTSIIKCHVFSGTNEYEPPCSLLQIDDFYCLLDCGWDSKFRDDYVHQVAKYTNKIDAVFISHSDIRYLGALPYLVSKCGLDCPVYMTSPVHRMGQLFLYDAYLSLCKAEEFNTFDLDAVDEAFDLVVDLKYQQTKNLTGKASGVSITPYIAGHMIGGAIWKIVKDGLEIIYAIDYNHKKENHLNGAMFNNIQSPHLLITSSYHAFQKSSKKFQEEHLKQTIQETIKNDGNVLILSDTAGRSLELAYLLDKMWRNQKSSLMTNGLALISHVAHNVIDFAKSNVEWLSDELTSQFENTGVKPFQFRYMNVCHDIDDIKSLTKPMVALVSQSHLNYGVGRELLAQWCENENNLVIVTSKNREYCLTTELLNYAQQTDKQDIMKINLKDKHRINIDDFIQKLTQKSLVKEKELDVNDLGMDDDEDDLMDCDNFNNVRLLIKQEVPYLPQDKYQTASKGYDISSTSFDVYPNKNLQTSDHWYRASQRLCISFPCAEEKTSWGIYGKDVDIKDTNFLNSDGSSYAMDIINQKLNVHKMKSFNVTKNPHKPHQESLFSVNNAKEQSDLANNSKDLLSLENMVVNCGVIFEEYEGLSDAAAIRQTLINCKPQEIIIIGGNKAESDEVADFCRMNLNMKGEVVHVPERGELVDCTKEGHIYQAKMSDALISNLLFTKVGNYEVAWLDAVIKVPESMDVDKEVVDNSDQIPCLDLPETNFILEHKTAFINEPKLSDLKQLLMNKGMNAEFNGGILVIDNCVTIKKNDKGKMMLEGTVCDTYFEVREVLYSQFAIL